MNTSILPGYAAGTPAEVPVDPKSLRALFESMLPRDVIAEAVERLGVQKRERLLDPVELIFSLVLMGGTAESAECGRLASVVRDYFDRGGTQVATGERSHGGGLLAITRRRVFAAQLCATWGAARGSMGCGGLSFLCIRRVGAVGHNPREQPAKTSTVAVSVPYVE